jgi:hypothetical protein
MEMTSPKIPIDQGKHRKRQPTNEKCQRYLHDEKFPLRIFQLEAVE